MRHLTQFVAGLGLVAAVWALAYGILAGGLAMLSDAIFVLGRLV